MLQNFQFRHLPALFTACAQCWGAVWPLIGGTSSVMLHYGLPEHIANVPETWPVWHAGQARTTLTGLLMFYFYSQGQYDILDKFLVAIGSFLGVMDCIILWGVGLPKEGIFRLVGSGVFTVLGLMKVTQEPNFKGVGGKAEYKA